MSQFSHLDSSGRARMVDVGAKQETHRRAAAQAYVTMKPDTLKMILEGGHSKGDVFAVARIAGIQAAKKCADLIPLCHPLLLTSIAVELTAEPDNNRVRRQSSCELKGQTGVEMEALTAVSVTALTIYDMCKAVEKDMAILDISLKHKSGGKSGTYVRASPSHRPE